MPEPYPASVTTALETVISWMGDDPQSIFLNKTPIRCCEFYEFMSQGYRQDPRSVLEATKPLAGDNELNVVRDAHFFTLCQHHMVPAIGKAHLAYIPGEVVVYPQSLIHCLHLCARRLTTLEEIAKNWLDFVVEKLNPLGAAIFIEAHFLCCDVFNVQARAAKQQVTGTRGLLDDLGERREWLQVLGLDK